MSDHTGLNYLMGPRSDRLYPTRFNDRYYHLVQLRKSLEKVTQLESFRTKHHPVLVDMGCGEKPYRALFEPYVDCYIGVDLPDNPHADVYLDSEKGIHLLHDSADIVLSTQVLEHVLHPSTYLSAIHHVLREQGLLILSTHGYWMHHPDPVDLWRWTGAGLQRLLAESGFSVTHVAGVMGLAASGMQLLQDGLLRHWHWGQRLPLPLRRTTTLLFQSAIQAVDWTATPQSRQLDASVFVIVAQKEGSS
ncbi:MAG TPA: methyltransferase domain-containing protein [Caldilinea sp.]|nr:methyltransferase domain-containing protein [Anaerolineales bacterium]HRA65406.1 methyltransferase domain-containing protein [Caldilinea sp.]